MIFVDGGLILLVLWLACIIDVLVTDEHRVRNLPKVVWVIIVLLLPDVGSLLWLIAGHPWDSLSRSRPATSRLAREFPEYDRPGRHVATNPDDDEAFLRQVRERAEQQRQRAREERRLREQREARELNDQAGPE
ncbi:MAG TPA: PLD nuclease N-terminal domain-containing protein [Rugosimonospora sp.]|nr:PLD nuclease N-terminal domain-containing protein [Rugosimonospora sp.]